MKAAVISDLLRPPACAHFEEPPTREGYVTVRPLAAGVHQLVRSLAAGAHYAAGDALPFVAGVDCVADLDGVRVYTGGTPDPWGTIAELAPVRRGFTVPVPEELGSEFAAAVVNPAMSSWIPLVTRGVRPGSTVLVNGATGTAGQLAVVIARQLGAERVIAAGRDAAVLERLDAMPGVTGVSLRNKPAEALADALADGVDIVLDYLWGAIAEATLDALRGRDLHGTPDPVEYVQIGAVAGRSLALDASVLRARPIRISGSGGGSIDPAVLFTELPKILAFAATGALDFPIRTAPLEEVAQAWDADSAERLVISMPR